MADVETLQITPLLDVYASFGDWSPDSEKIAYTNGRKGVPIFLERKEEHPSFFKRDSDFLSE